MNRSSAATIATTTIVAIAMATACNSDTRNSSDVPGERYVHPKAVTYLREAAEALDNMLYLSALAYLDSAQVYATQIPEVHFLRGQVQFEIGLMDEAAESYNRVLARQGDYPGAWHNLGNVAFEQGRFRDALACYRREAAARDEARPWHGMGGAYWTLGRVDSARWAYEQAISKSRDYAPAHQSLAEWHESGGDFESALASASRAYEIDPENLEVQRLVGLLYFRTGAADRAIPILEDVVEERPWDYTALFGLGQALRQVGRTDTAAIVLIKSDSVRAEQQVVERLERTANDQADNFQAQIGLADALRRSGRLDEAIRRYHRAMSLRPANLALQNNLATMYVQRGDISEAAHRYQAILKTDSTFAESWLNLGLFYLQQGRSAEAQNALWKAERYGADNPRVRAVLERLGR